MSKVALDTIWLIFMGLIDITILYRFVTEIVSVIAGRHAPQRGRRAERRLRVAEGAAYTDDPGNYEGCGEYEGYTPRTLADAVDRFAAIVMLMGIVVVVMLLAVR